ncbi:MAG: flagellar type III secretion system protein FliR [Gammaproteobacteria bacterium]|nr:MAG: flagellar type III secretion system protein FliR [Gammaproteobacteria bacterium]
MNIAAADISAWIGTYLWPLFRIGALFGAMPVIGIRMVPGRVRLALALALTLVVAPIIPPAPAVDPLSVAGAMITLQQILIGAAMGFLLSLVFGAFVYAGQLVAMQMGLGFASLMDPQHGVEVPVISQFYLVVVTLVFLALDGHLAVIEVLVESFHALPVSPTGLTVATMWQIVTIGGHLFSGALSVALPALVAMLLVNLAFGVMTRAAPQLNIFSVGFPVTLLFGFVVLLLSLPLLGPQFQGLFDSEFALIRHLFAGGP